MLHSEQIASVTSLTFDMITYICCGEICMSVGDQGVAGLEVTKTEIYQRLLDHFVSLPLSLPLPGLQLPFPPRVCPATSTSLDRVSARNGTGGWLGCSGAREDVSMSVFAAARQKCPYNIFYFVARILK